MNIQPITNKQQNFEAVNAGLWGNHVRQWPSLQEWTIWFIKLEDEQLNNIARLYMLRSFKPNQIAKKVCTIRELVDMSYEEADGYYVNECIDNSTVILNAEVQLGAHGIEMMYSELACTMREAQAADWRPAKGLFAKMLLQSKLCERGYEKLMEILNTYDDHIVEVTACSCGVGELGWRTIIWEVRKY